MAKKLSDKKRLENLLLQARLEAEAEAEAHKAALTPRKAKKKAKTGSGVGKSPATPNTEDTGPAELEETDSPL